jgi:tRNA(fMet)-specific endonuclease VapC
MGEWLLDTNHVSPLVTPGHRLRARVHRALNDGERFWVIAPVVAEAVYGISVVPRSTQNLETWGVLKPKLNYYDVSLTDAVYAAELRVSLRQQGWQLQTIDALIAAVAIRADFVLLTTDRDFRGVPGLMHENWLE